MSGDARLELWERTCQCGGARKSPDVRMCRCPAAQDAGLGCKGCGAGVLLMKDGGRGTFWGCSNYNKSGCKFTRPFGAPHDSAAAAALRTTLATHGVAAAACMHICRDTFEREWGRDCRCGAAENLDTLACFLQSEGGCGMLPSCPIPSCAAKNGMLFLRNSRGGTGASECPGLFPAPVQGFVETVRHPRSHRARARATYAT